MDLRASHQEPLGNTPMWPSLQHPLHGPISRSHSKYSLWLREGRGGLDFREAQEDPEKEVNTEVRGAGALPLPTAVPRVPSAVAPSPLTTSERYCSWGLTSGLSLNWAKAGQGECLRGALRLLSPPSLRSIATGRPDAWPCAKHFPLTIPFYPLTHEIGAIIIPILETRKLVFRGLSLSQVTQLLRDKS